MARPPALARSPLVYPACVPPVGWRQELGTATAQLLAAADGTGLRASISVLAYVYAEVRDKSEDYFIYYCINVFLLDSCTM